MLRPENRPEILLHDRPEEVQGEHVEQQVSPSAMDQAVGKQLVPFPAVPYFIRIEHQRIDIQCSGESQYADQAGNADDDECDSDIHTLRSVARGRLRRKDTYFLPESLWQTVW